MRASAAIPSLFSPVRQGNRVLVDGGLLNPLPIVPVVSAHCDLIMAVNLNSIESNHYQMPVIERPAPIRQQWEQWMAALKPSWLGRRAEEEEEQAGQQALPLTPEEGDEPHSREEDQHSPVEVEPPVGPASMLELVNLSFEAMQASLTQYKIAGYPPDVVFNVPKRLCRFFEFYRAPELIELGRMVASDTLDQFERRQH